MPALQASDFIFVYTEAAVRCKRQIYVSVKSRQVDSQFVSVKSSERLNFAVFSGPLVEAKRSNKKQKK